MSEDRSGTIVGRYQRYKAGTKRIVTWLATTAAQHCNLRNALDCLKATPTSRGSNGTPAPDDVHKIRVKTQELVDLAKIIAAVDALTVPAGIIKVLQDSIDGRQNAAEWYASQTRDGDSELAGQKERRSHFIGILQRVQGYLIELPITPDSEIECIAVATVKKQKKKKNGNGGIEQPVKPIDEMRNLFEYLDVEEPSAFPLGEAGPARPGDGAPSYELDGDEDADVFVLWCHLKDMSDTRLFVREV